MVFGWKVKGQRYLVLGLTAIRRGFELYDCLLDIIIIIIINFLIFFFTLGSIDPEG